MKRKVLISSIVITMMLASNVPVFATTGVESISDQNEASRNAKVVEEIVGTSDLMVGLDEAENSFTAIVDGETIAVPKEGDGAIKMTLDEMDKEILMELPKEAGLSDAVMERSGTIIYEGENDATVSVQPLQVEEEELSIMGNRTLVTIDNENASQNYSFEYKLPTGARLITSENYYQVIENDGTIDIEDFVLEKGWVYVTDKNNEILAAIEPAWAQDANGNDVPTHYEISGTTLIQVVEFDKNSKFPIVADPKTTTKPKSEKVGNYSYTCKLSHNAIGLGITSAGGAYKITTTAKKNLEKKIAAKLGGAFVPAFGWASLAVGLYGSIASAAGYNYTQFTVKYEKWTQYKHQAGAWRKGYRVKVTKTSAKWCN